MLSQYLNIGAIAAIVAVAIVLLMGLLNMRKGTNPNRSQILMRWRIGLQFVAVVLIMAALYFTSK